jgi:DNA polymerase III delta prime subunit
MLHDDFLWVEKYRPKTVADTILSKNLKAIFQSFVDQKNIPTLLLTGPSGVGKTTIARAMLEELGCDYIMINGSLEGRLIDTLRTTIVDYASTVSFIGGRKYIIIDEADYMNAQSVQPALRNFIEEFSSNCGFILTCNYKSKLIPAIHSRCSIIEFKLPENKAEQQGMVVEFFGRVIKILDKENIKYDKAAVAEVIKRFYPDWRRILNELQKYSASGTIDSGILHNVKEVALNEVCALLKNKDFKSLRKWVTENADIDPAYLFSSFFDHACQYFKKSSVPVLILLLAKYQYQVPFVANQEINTMAFFVEVMTEAEFVE